MSKVSNPALLRRIFAGQLGRIDLRLEQLLGLVRLVYLLLDLLVLFFVVGELDCVFFYWGFIYVFPLRNWELVAQ